jgi:hypothetical protein
MCKQRLYLDYSRRFFRLLPILPYLLVTLFTQNGFMPSKSANGEITIVICTPNGKFTQLLDLGDSQEVSGADQSSPESESSTSQCVYSLAHNPIVIGVQLGFLVGGSFIFVLGIGRSKSSYRQRFFNDSFPRGPPFIVLS